MTQIYCARWPKDTGRILCLNYFNVNIWVDTANSGQAIFFNNFWSVYGFSTHSLAWKRLVRLIFFNRFRVKKTLLTHQSFSPLWHLEVIATIPALLDHCVVLNKDKLQTFLSFTIRQTFSLISSKAMSVFYAAIIRCYKAHAFEK